MLSVRKQKGFTLIELLVVIAIIGILSSIVLASLQSSRQKGRDARRISDIKQIQLALELYYDANSAYPTSTSPTALVTPGYISVIPVDPSTNAAYSYAGLQGPAASAATCLSYHLGATLEVTTNVNVFSQDVDATVGGTFGNNPNTDGAICTNSGADFAGTDPVYDVRP